MILDQYNRPMTSARPKKEWPYSYQVGDRDYETSVRGLSPSDVWTATADAYLGKTAGLQSIFEQALGSDGHLHSLDQRRRGGVAGLDYEIRPYVAPGAEGDPEDPDKDLAEYCSEHLLTIPDLQENIKSILDAIGKGFSVLEIRWEKNKKGVIIPRMRSLPQRLFTWQRQSAREVVTTEWPQILTQDQRSYGEELDPLHYIVSIYKDRNTEPFRCGVMWTCIWYWLRKHEGWAQTMEVGERFANTPLVAYLSPDEFGGPERDTLRSAMRAYAGGQNIVIPGTGGPVGMDKDDTFRGAFLTHPQQDLRIPGDFWKLGRDDCDREMSKAWSGGNLTVDTTGGTGTLSSTIQQRANEVQDFRKPDSDWTADSPLARLIELFVFVNKGVDATERLPLFSFLGLEIEEDLSAKATAIETLLKANWEALPNVPKEILEIYGLPEMEEQETPPEEVPPALPAKKNPFETEEEEFTEEEEKAVAAYLETETDTLDGRLKRMFRPLHACGREPLLAAAASTTELSRRLGSLLAKVDPYTEGAAAAARDKVTAYLLRMKRVPKSPQAFQRAVLKLIRASHADLYEELEAAGLGDWFEDTYKYYRLQDRSAWPAGRMPSSAMTWGAADKRMVAHMTTTPIWHFSTYTDNLTYRKPMQSFLAREYAENGAQLFVRDEKIVAGFRRRLGKTTKKLAAHEVDRIARTSVARAREEARLMQMHAAGVKTATVTVHPDACDICAGYAGESINVKSEVEWVEHLESLSPKKWEKAIKKHGREALKGVPPHDFVQGGGAPLYHPQCRCSIDMK